MFSLRESLHNIIREISVKINSFNIKIWNELFESYTYSGNLSVKMKTKNW